MFTRFDYTVNGVKHSELIFTPSAMAYNLEAERLLKIADPFSLRCTTVYQ